MNPFKSIFSAVKSLHETRQITAKIEHQTRQLAYSVQACERQERELAQAMSEIFDQLFAVTVAAVKSGNSRAAAKLGDVTNACVTSAERAGFNLIVPDQGQAFDSERHQVADGDNCHHVVSPCVVSEIIKPGYMFRDRLLRHALVTVRDE